MGQLYHFNQSVNLWFQGDEAVAHSCAIWISHICCVYKSNLRSDPDGGGWPDYCERESARAGGQTVTLLIIG
jgi:hypothetical protein